MQQLFHITKRIYHPHMFAHSIQTFTFIPLAIAFQYQKRSLYNVQNEDQMWEEILLNNLS